MVVSKSVMFLHEFVFMGSISSTLNSLLHCMPTIRLNIKLDVKVRIFIV